MCSPDLVMDEPTFVGSLAHGILAGSACYLTIAKGNPSNVTRWFLKGCLRYESEQASFTTVKCFLSTSK